MIYIFFKSKPMINTYVLVGEQSLLHCQHKNILSRKMMFSVTKRHCLRFSSLGKKRLIIIIINFWFKNVTITPINAEWKNNIICKKIWSTNTDVNVFWKVSNGHDKKKGLRNWKTPSDFSTGGDWRWSWYGVNMKT